MRVNRLLHIVAAAASLAALSAGGAYAQRASITGRVVDSAARPVPNADVVAYPGSHRARTDSTGAFHEAAMKTVGRIAFVSVPASLSSSTPSSVILKGLP